MAIEMKGVGILALQGDYEMHERKWLSLGVSACRIREPDQLEKVDRLILPGGESSTLAKLMSVLDWDDSIAAFHRQGKPIWGTCAGMILLSKSADRLDSETLRLMDISVRRNGYGPQIESAVGEGEVLLDGSLSSFPMVFIRAPRIISIGQKVERLGFFRGECVMARQANILATSFHPELVSNDVVERFFMAI